MKLRVVELRGRKSYKTAVSEDEAKHSPDQAAHALLGDAVQVGEGAKFIHQPLWMRPAQ